MKTQAKVKADCDAWHYGYPVYYWAGAWLYKDNDKSIDEESRPCIRCLRYPTKEGYDACLGKIDRVKSACCGHGTKKGYVLYEEGVRLEDVGLSVYLMWLRFHT